MQSGHAIFSIVQRSLVMYTEEFNELNLKKNIVLLCNIAIEYDHNIYSALPGKVIHVHVDAQNPLPSPPWHIIFLAFQVLVVIDAKPKDLGLPTEAYISVEEVHDVCKYMYQYSGRN